MRRILWLLIRFVIGLGLSAAIVLLLIIRPHKQAVTVIETYVKQLKFADNSLEDGAKTLSDLPAPDTITLRSRGSVRSYVQTVKNALPAFNTQLPAQPDIGLVIWQNRAITTYNETSREEAFQEAYNRLSAAINNSANFTRHHAAIMQALANLLEYDPVIDTESTNPQVILDHLIAAAGGLNKTKHQLEQAPPYDDPSLEAIFSAIKTIEDRRDAFDTAAQAGTAQGPEKAAFITAVTDAQQTILHNRIEYWQSTQPDVSEQLRAARSGIHQYLTRLYDIL